jgi:hypothetical protein
METNTERQAQLFSQLQRRKVLRSTTIYAVLGWCLLQWCNLLFDGLGWPEWSLSIAVAMVVLGFPVVVALSWVFDITPSGVHRTEQGQPEQATSVLIRWVVNIAVALVFVGTVASLVTG